MTFPLVILLIVYLAFFAVFCIVSAMNIYHVVRFGAFDRKNATIMFFYILVAVTIIAASSIYLLGVDWGASVDIPLPSFESRFS